MKSFSKEEQKNYEKSNKIEKVALSKFSKLFYANLLADKNRQKDSQLLVEYLSEKFGISTPKVVIKETPQPHATNLRGSLKSKTYGTYQVGTETITIYNKTAVRKEQVSIKQFADTLLHEFMHHYDTKYLKIQTIHSAGFYKRISDLKEKLS